MRRIFVFALAALAVSSVRADSIAWTGWSDDLFARAQREHKFVILDLEAVWCHWCHVMDATTYRDPRVIALIGGNYIAVRVDKNSRPALATRYGTHGGLR